MRKNPFAKISAPTVNVDTAPPPPSSEPIQFDTDYFNRLAKWINSKDNVVYTIADYTENPEKFIFHVKYYIDNITDDMAHVEFNDEFTKIHVLCFIQSKINQLKK